MWASCTSAICLALAFVIMLSQRRQPHQYAKPRAVPALLAITLKPAFGISHLRGNASQTAQSGVSIADAVLLVVWRRLLD